MIENCQNKADSFGVNPCHISSHEKESEIPTAAPTAAETSGISTNLYLDALSAPVKVVSCTS